ncbi:MAG: glutamate--tRNA ligase [Candidatus Thorarchaeota archaeon]
MENDDIRKIIWVYGLKNAVEFNGMANAKAVMGKLMMERPDLRPKAKNYFPLIEEILKYINNMKSEEQVDKLLELDPHALDQEDKKEEKKELPQLPNLGQYKNIVMRMAPYPSGALHIGNARMVILNHEYIKRYKGKLILFFDDTIGSPKSLRDSPKAKYVLPEAYKLIEDGIKWLDVTFDETFYKSERLDIYYNYCEKLIKDNIAYVCFCEAEEFRNKFKNLKKECPHRNQPIQHNLNEWIKMLKGEYQETEVVVRIKTGMDQKDPALRDQIIMRISDAPHPRVGNKYHVWPMLEFSWAIDDHLIGVSHILRGMDLIKEDFIENFIWDHFKWKKAQFMHYGRINFPSLKLSKTEARNNILNGIYDGWEDPRTWSLQSLNMRGIKPEALRKTLLDLGMSTTGINFDEDWLYSKNKEIIDGISERYFYVENPIKVKIINTTFSEYTAKPLIIPSDPDKGTRKIKVSVKNNTLIVYISNSDAVNLKANQIIRLKDLVNIEIISKSLKKKEIQAKFHSLKLNRAYSIIQWVPEHDNVQVSILKPDGFLSQGYAEANLIHIPLLKPIQFERYGFVNPIRWDNQKLICYFTH